MFNVSNDGDAELSLMEIAVIQKRRNYRQDAELLFIEIVVIQNRRIKIWDLSVVDSQQNIDTNLMLLLL